MKGHSGESGNEAADKLAGEGSARLEPDQIEMRPNPALMLPGAKLQALTQSRAYKIIRQIKMNQPTYQEKLDRKATKSNMEYAQAAVADLSDELPEKGTIWKSIKHKDISRNIRYFLWMLIHDGCKVGKYGNDEAYLDRVRAPRSGRHRNPRWAKSCRVQRLRLGVTRAQRVCTAS